MVETTVAALDGSLTSTAKNRMARAAIREDARAIDGMVRFLEGKQLPWRADRPAIALYETLAQDGRLPSDVRNAIAATVLAHRETDDYAPFDDADYSNAYGPTVHFPIGRNHIDPWAPQMSETDNASYKIIGAADLTKALA